MIPDGIPQFGLIAEQVDKVNPDLVVRDEDGKVIHCALRSSERDVAQRVPERAPQGRSSKTEVLQQADRKISNCRKAGRDHRQLAHGRNSRSDFQATTAHQQEQIEALTAGLQKVSAQLELNKPAPQLVADNQ